MSDISAAKVIKSIYSFIDDHLEECKEDYLPAFVNDAGFVTSKCIFTLGETELIVTFDGGKWAYEIDKVLVSPEVGAVFHNRILDRLKERKLEKKFESWWGETNQDLELKHFKTQDAIQCLLAGKPVKINI